MDGVNIKKMEKLANVKNSKRIVMDGDNSKKMEKLANVKNPRAHNINYRHGWCQH